MVLPIILGAIALGAGALGVTKGVEGAGSFEKAKAIQKNALDKYNRRRKRLELRAERVNIEAADYGKCQQEMREQVVARVAKLLVELGKKANINVCELLAGVDIHIPSVVLDGRHEVKPESIVQGFVAAAGASAASSAATTGAVTMFATASTGAAISGLSGAAANSAMLAALGGGSLAAGGGGMALGSLVLGGIVAGPAIAVGGFAIAAEGEKCLTKAIEYNFQVNKEIAKMDAKETIMDGIVQRLWELGLLLKRLRDRSLDLLSELEPLAAADLFSIENVQHMEKLRALLLIVRTLNEILATEILSSDGTINPDIDVVIKKVSI